jgi:riboflavin kinase/FMN adenylyltransferase
MQIYRHIGDLNPTLQGSVVTLGNFDGIHLGHQALIGGAVAEAKRLGVPAAVLTFEPHPLKVLAPERAPKMLLAHKDKMQLLQHLGVEMVVVQHFDLSFAKISAEEFVRDLLVGRLKAKKILVGRDLRFGQGRKGSVDDLVHWGSNLGFEVGVVEPILVHGARVSSSQIRQLIDDGRVEDVEPMLGRYHFLSGRVTGGHRRGRDLGFPTANISTRTEVLPLDGIYATLFHLGERRFLSASSVGLNPTFGAGPRTIESFILNFDNDIYGEAVKLSFVKRIRDEMKFTSVEALIARIRADVECAQTVLRELNLHE